MGRHPTPGGSSRLETGAWRGDPSLPPCDGRSAGGSTAIRLALAGGSGTNVAGTDYRPLSVAAGYRPVTTPAKLALTMGGIRHGRGLLHPANPLPPTPPPIHWKDVQCTGVGGINPQTVVLAGDSIFFQQIPFKMGKVKSN